MKKILSVMLVLILLVSSIYTGVWADNTQVVGENLMENYTHRDWRVTNRATINAPTESFSGNISNAFSVTKLMWRSIYTGVTLEAGETYELSFYYKEDAPDKVWLTDNGNRGVAMAPASGLTVSGVDEIAVDYSTNLLNDVNYNIPSDKAGWNVVTAKITPTVSGEHLLYFTGASVNVNDLDLIHFSDFSLVKQGKDSNALANTTAADWISGWNGNTGVSVGDAIAVKTAWRSGYTKVTLKPNTTYNFNFEASTVKITDVRVYAASEITSNTQLTCPAGGGNLPGGTNNLANGAFNSSAHSGDFATLDAETVSTYYSVSETFTTGSESEYYIVLDCTQFLDNGSVNIYCTFVHLKNLNLVAANAGNEPDDNVDPNVLNDEVMRSITWTAIWNTGLRNPKSAELDKSQSYSGNSYAMTFDRNARYRDNYITVTLEPNTTYDFSFRYKASGVEEQIHYIGFVDASKVNTTTYKGDTVEAHITDSSATVLGKANASIGRETNGVWNPVSTTFTTGSATKYIMYMGIGSYVDNSFATITLSDFSLVAQEKDDDDDVPVDPNALNDEVMKSLTWSALWASTPASSKRDPKTAELDKSQSYSGNAYAMTWGGASRYRDNYTVVTLEPNTTYNFSFRYKSGTAQERVDGIGFVDAFKVDLSTVKSDYISGHLTDASTPILGKTEAVIGNVTDGSWNEVTTTFTTTNSKEYIMYLSVNFNGTTFSSLTLSDFSLVAQENDDDDELPDDTEDPDEENALANSKATDWFSSWSGASGTDANGAISVRAAYRSAYTKVTLKPNTKYNLSFSHGEVRVTDIRVFAASEITDSANQLITPDSNGGPAPGGTNNLAIDAVATNCPATPVAGEFYTSSESFTTTNETEYYIFVDCGAFSTTAILLKDLTLVSATEDVNPESPVLQLLNVENWNSTWRLQGANINITKSADSCEGGEAISVDKSNYRTTFVKLILDANTKYKFTFNYKGKSAISNLHLLALNDIDEAKYAAKPDHIVNALKDGASKVFTQSYSALNYDGTTWNEVSAEFATNANTEYYLVFENNTAGSGFIASDFKVEIDITTDIPEENILANTTPENWTSSWGGVSGTDSNGAISIRCAYRSAYTKVTLAPNTKYELSFSHGEVRVTDIRVYDAAEITDVANQMITKDENGGYAEGGTNDLAYELITTNCPATPVAGEFYTSSESFKTGTATEYYIILDCSAFSTTAILLKDLRLVKSQDQSDEGDNNPIDPNNILGTTKAKDWTSSWGPAVGVAQGKAISLRAAYRSAYTKVTLKPNVTYHFNFNFEHVKITDIRVYAASEITDLDKQMVSGENGGAVIGGSKNIATDSITTDCSSPVPDKVYSAFEAFTTASATEYYIILDFAMGDGVSNNILLTNLKLVKYYDATTDVYGNVSGGIGGSVSNKGKSPYEKGKETTITATPLSGNTFDGWYDADGNKVSSNTDYTFVVEKEFDITAKFSGANMPYIDWLSENGMDGTFENGAMPGWYAVDEGTGVLATFASFNPNTFASHSGEKAMAMIARYQHSYFHFNNLSKNSDYYLSFYIYCPDLTPYDSSADVGHRGFKINEMYLSVGDDTVWSKGTVFDDGNNGWHKIEFFFNTGDKDVATLCINYYGDANVAERAVYLDDVTFVQYMADSLDNGDFTEGNKHWMGDYTVNDAGDNKVAELQNGKKIYQSLAVEPHSRYTVSFRAKGKAVAAVSKINKYSTDVNSIISSVASITTPGEEKEYSLDIYTGMNSAINLVFEALEDGVQLDDIKLTLQEETAGAVLEKIDFETERFAIKNSTTNKDVYEIYEGTEFARSGNKSLHFKYSAADSKTEYIFNESYIGFQISNKRVYRLTFYYKTKNGSTIKISPDFLGDQAGNVGIEQTAVGDGWNRVDFFASSSNAIYFDPIIANIVGKTKADFYIDDITYTIVSAAVLETGIEKLYAEPPVALLYNEGFEEAITAENWGQFPSTMSVVKGDTEFGNKYLKVNGKTQYVLPVKVEAGVQYYFSASLRGTSGYIGLSTTSDAKGLFAGVSGEVESFIKPASKKWNRDGIKFSAPVSGVIYLVITCDTGYLDIDNVLIYKENYGLLEKPYGHDILPKYDYSATSGKNYIINGGYTADGEIAE